jgi:hypothetical protein
MRALPVALSTRTARSSRVMPAAGTHSETLPCWLLMASKTEARNFSSVVLPWNGTAKSRPASALSVAAMSATASFMSTSATAATSRRAIAAATARPMPLPPPVMTATLFAMSTKPPRRSAVAMLHETVVHLGRAGSRSEAARRCFLALAQGSAACFGP